MAGQRNKNIDISDGGFEKRLKRLRRARGLTKPELAEKAGLSGRGYHNIESGKQKRVLEKTVFLLASALEVSPDELLHGKPADSPATTNARWHRNPAIAAGILIALIVIVTFAIARLVIDNPVPDIEIPPPSVTTDSEEAYLEFVAGDTELAKVNRDGARRHYRRALELDSTFAMAAIRLTNPQLRQNSEQDSLLAQAQRHAHKVTDVERYYIRSRAKQLEPDLPGAIAVLESLTRQHPDEKFAYSLQGTYYSYLKDHQNVIQAFEKSLAIDATDPATWNSLAYAYHSIGDVESALRAADRYISLVPNETNPYDTRGDILARNGRPREAILSYKEALRRDAGFFTATQALGVLHLLTRDYTKASAYFEDLTFADDPGARSHGRFLEACVPLYQGNLNDAMTKLNEGLAEDRLEDYLNAPYFQKMCMKVMLLSAQGALEDAVAQSSVMLRAVSEFSAHSSPEWIDDHVYILTRAGRLAEAEALIDTSAAYVSQQFGRQNCYYWTARGWLDLAHEDYDAACSHFELAYDEEPFLHHGYPLGISYFKSARPGDAIRVFEACLKRYKEDRVSRPIQAVKTYYYLGIAYEEVGRPGDAAAQFREFLEIWKDADPVFDEIKADARRRLSKTTS
jgi:tetratricopeptide (TPR) repeat protein